MNFSLQVFCFFFKSWAKQILTGVAAKKNMSNHYAQVILTFIKMNICKLFSPKAALYYANFLTLSKVTESILY